MKNATRLPDTQKKRGVNGNTLLLLITIVLFVVMYATGCLVYARKGFAHLQTFLNLLITNAGLICVTCGMKTAAVGGPYGMALLAAYAGNAGKKSLEQFLSEDVFAHTQMVLTQPSEEDAAGFQKYLEKFKAGLAVEKASAAVLP